jgi:hypothetical protein
MGRHIFLPWKYVREGGCFSRKYALPGSKYHILLMLLLPPPQPLLVKETNDISPCQGAIQGLELLFGIPGVRQFAMSRSGDSHIAIDLDKVFARQSLYILSRKMPPEIGMHRLT